jgi:hypothetical protein
MRNNNEPKHTFLNRRDWGSFVSALQGAAAYPSVVEAVKSGRAWFTEGAAHASNWLAGSERLADRFSVG